jgi:hypothetical protein
MGEAVQDQSMERGDPTSPKNTRRLVLIGVLSLLAIAALLYQTRPAMISPLGTVLAFLLLGTAALLATFLLARRNALG